LTHLHFDCFSGAAGDMILGALIDCGLPLAGLRAALGGLAVDHDEVWTERVNRAGIVATKFRVRDEETQTHPHRHVTAIHELIDRSSLSAGAKDRAKGLFTRLAEAEAAIHGTTVEKVHLHEVGALDSIVDVVGAVYAIEQLGIERVTASPLNVGSGTVQTAHGRYPVPAPATARLLSGASIYSGPQQAELVTPTGALLITHYAESYGPVPPMQLEKVGYGAGTRDFPDAPNVLRVLIGESQGKGHSHSVVQIEAEIDDMNPQIFGLLMDKLLETGALDVFYTPIQMKKNRPGTLLSIIAPPSAREALMALVFRETTTIGIRYTEMKRECLDRESVMVETPFGPVAVKVARRNGEILNASPEFEDCARVAAASGRPVKDVHAAAMKAFLDRRS
jgi:uncharacterized protein (TIGR00299 family) protein